MSELETCRVRRALITRTNRVLAMFHSFEKCHVLPIAVVRMLRGPLRLEPELSQEVRRAVLQLVRRQFRLAGRELVIWSPSLPTAPQAWS